MADLRGIFENNRGDGRALLMRAIFGDYKSVFNGVLLCGHGCACKDFIRFGIDSQCDQSGGGGELI